MNYNYGSLTNPMFIRMDRYLDPDDFARLRGYINNWNFYEGYHFENISSDGESPEVVENYVARFVDKFVASEFNGGFTFNFDNKVEEKILPFLNEVWEDNKRDELCIDIGQMKSVTGDAYVHVMYEPKFINGQPNPDFFDPFDLYEHGRIRLFLVPSSICFPKWKSGYDMTPEAMESCTIMYPEQIINPIMTSDKSKRYNIIRYVYYPDRIEYYINDDLSETYENKYGIIPIVPIKNLPMAGRNYGKSDIQDIIPINVEMNIKDSDISEIIDYHSAPVTVVYGARVSQLEKGANKVWGGLPHNSKVENLELKGDLAAANNYRGNLKVSLHEVGGIPKIAFGGEMPPANISGVALNIAFMPLLEVVDMKRRKTKEAFKLINNIIIKIGISEGIIGEAFSREERRMIFSGEVVFGDVLPRDIMQELEQAQVELKMGIESRRGVMERMSKGNIEEKMKEIETDRKDNFIMYGITPTALTAGQKLFNPETGEEIANNPAPKPIAPAGGEPTGKPSSPTKTSSAVGENKEGKPIKVNSGVTNSNPGKK